MIEVPMTDAQFAAAAERLRTYGLELSGPSGTLSREGITAEYSYTAGMLRIEIVKKPMLLPLSVVEGRLKSYIEQSLPPGSGAANA